MAGVEVRLCDLPSLVFGVRLANLSVVHVCNEPVCWNPERCRDQRDVVALVLVNHRRDPRPFPVESTVPKRRARRWPGGRREQTPARRSTVADREATISARIVNGDARRCGRGGIPGSLIGPRVLPARSGRRQRGRWLGKAWATLSAPALGCRVAKTESLRYDNRWTTDTSPRRATSRRARPRQRAVGCRDQVRVSPPMRCATTSGWQLQRPTSDFRESLHLAGLKPNSTGTRVDGG